LRLLPIRSRAPTRQVSIDHAVHEGGFAMLEIESFSELVGDIYDASLDPALWPSVCETACAFVGASGAGLIWQDTLRKAAHLYFSFGVEPRFLENYKETYCKLNPAFPTLLFFDVEEVHSVVPDCVSRDELRSSRFGREWLLPQGLIDGLFCNVKKSATSCDLFLAVRSMGDGFADDEMHRRFALVAPHVRRAVLIGEVLDQRKVEAAALADGLDTLTAGMFLVDAIGRIVHANASGHMMVADAKVVRAASGKLAAADPQADEALFDSFTASAGGDATLGRRGIAVPLRARNGEPYVANVLPLTSGARRRAGVSYAAVAIVFVNKAVLDLPSPPEAIAQEFGLTPAELRVLFAVMEVGGVSDVAEVLGISAATVKTHLQRLFEKTGTARQVELVKLVAGYSNALVG
jgi:DNA-binding CsgD family transcriptional regulator